MKEKYKEYLKNDSEPEKTLKSIEDNYVFLQDKKYSTALLKKLKELEQKQEKKKCLVIMPFSDTHSCEKKEWSQIFQELIKPAAEESFFNYECVRANLVHGKIDESVIDSLNRSELVIADLTDRNPHVFYGLGLRQGLRDKTILISQNTDDIPSDLRAYTVLTYAWKRGQDRKNFKTLIKAAIADIENNPQKACSPVRKYLSQ